MAGTLKFGMDMADAEPVESVERPAESIKSEVATVANVADEIEASDEGKPTQRSLSCVKLVGFGYPYTDIARMLNYATPRDAQRAFIAAVASTYKPEDAQTLRMKQSMRLERLLVSVMPNALDKKNADQLAYNRRANEIIDDLSKLHGVNAPTQLQLTTPDAEKFESVVGQLHAMLHGEAEEEGDFLELTEGPDGVLQEGDQPDVYE